MLEITWRISLFLHLFIVLGESWGGGGSYQSKAAYEGGGGAGWFSKINAAANELNM